MARKKKSYDNSLTELAVGVAMYDQLAEQPLSGYGTIGSSNNYSLITMNRIILTYLYSGSGIFQRAIRVPIQDAIRQGIQITSGEMDAEDIEKLLNWWERSDLWSALLNAWTWSRLYGGGALLLNSNQNPSQPLNYQRLQNSPLDFYDLDRWQIDANTAGQQVDAFKDYPDQEYYYLYGEKIHNSRMFTLEGRRAPHFIRQSLRGWGMSEGERMIRDLNLYMKTDNVLYEILDESKIDIYKIKGLANKLISKSGTDKIINRVMSANMIKNYVNALVLDKEEEFEQKTTNFAGLSEVKSENRLGIAAAIGMPITKLFGISASGFNTGESDLENYNSDVDSDVRRPARPLIRWMLDAGCSHLFGYVPAYSFEYPSLRVMSAVDEETVKKSKSDRILAWQERGLLTSQEAMQEAKREKLFGIETEAEKGLLDDFPEPIGGGDSQNIDF